MAHGHKSIHLPVQLLQQNYYQLLIVAMQLQNSRLFIHGTFYILCQFQIVSERREDVVPLKQTISQESLPS